MSVLADNSDPMLFEVTSNLSVKSGGESMTVSDGTSSYTFENLTRLEFHKEGQNSISAPTTEGAVVSISDGRMTEKVGINSSSVDIDETKGMLFEMSNEYDEK